MMPAMTPILTRIQSTATIVAALTLAAAAATAENKIPSEYRTGGFPIGCIVYTFDRFTLFEALEKTAEAGGTLVELSAKTKLIKEPRLRRSRAASGRRGDPETCARGRPHCGP